MRTQKKISAFLAFLLVIVMFSCTDNDSETYMPNPKQTASTFIQQAEAVDIARNAVLSLKGEAQTRTGEGSVLNVASVETTMRAATRTGGSAEDAFFYIVNFEEGGYAVVPSDKRAAGVYALSGEGEFSMDGNDGTEIFMELAEEHLKSELDIKDTVFNLGGGGFQPLPDPDDPSNFAIVVIGGEEYHDVIKETKTTPFYLLSTQWGQSWPYNGECYNSAGERVATGCVPIAMGQIMSLSKKPQSYNGHWYYWDRMPLKAYSYDGSKEAYSVAYLIHDIGLAVSVNYDDGSGAYYRNAPSAFVRFGYTCDGLKTYDVANVISSLKNRRPVYMRATEGGVGGHAWVSDGYYTLTIQHTYYSVKDLKPKMSKTEKKHYLHMNWGWNGDGNGYFFSEVFRPLGHNFDTQIMNICNIRYTN